MTGSSSREPADLLGTRFCGDPAECLDELVQELGQGKPIHSALELDWLAGMIFNHLAEHPVTYSHLLLWIRLQHTHILPAAIEYAVHELWNRGAIECIDDRWHTKRLLPIGFSMQALPIVRRKRRPGRNHLMRAKL